MLQVFCILSASFFAIHSTLFSVCTLGSLPYLSCDEIIMFDLNNHIQAGESSLTYKEIKDLTDWSFNMAPTDEKLLTEYEMMN